jgi:ribosomal protein S8
LRNKFIFTFIKFLLKEKLIESYRLIGDPKPVVMYKRCGIKLGKKGSRYYVPIELHLRHELVTKIFPVSTPGKYEPRGARELLTYTYQNAGAQGVVICSSSRLGGLCTANQLIALGEGGLVVCVVKITGGSHGGV